MKLSPDLLRPATTLMDMAGAETFRGGYSSSLTIPIILLLSTAKVALQEHCIQRACYA